MPNGLADETSPYLAQHADNPVDWFPWGPEAFAEAKRRDVPIFLSVGYSACHWCHVMAHESFEDDEVAAVLNARFVNVKVDREERPDVDAVYMEAVQAMTGRGGWPMSVFMTPDSLQPFYTGTYWPKTNRQGMPGFLSIIDAIHEAWTERRTEVLESSSSITERLVAHARTEQDDVVPAALVNDAATFIIENVWDRDLGGFGRAPKFPQTMTIGFLLDHHASTGDEASLTAATHALRAMADGGIHDQIGGGFARYSTDAKWLAPHFEKMLYDNALLLAEYARAHVSTGDQRMAQVATSTADYLLAEMRHELGGFFAATDADSEGVEGKFFVWPRQELIDVLDGAGLPGERLAELWNATEAGNWEASNILHLSGVVPDDLIEAVAAARPLLHAHRANRIPPGLDDKILTSWNALAIRGFAIAGRYLGRPDWIEVAASTASFLAEHLVVDGVLHHTWKNGVAAVPALLEDVAHLALALVELYEAGGDPAHLTWARALVQDARDRFHDDQDGAFFASAHEAEGLYRRPKDTWDNATPSSNSSLALAAIRLAALTGDASLHEIVDEFLRTFARSAGQSPPGQGMFLQVALASRTEQREVAIVGPAGAARDALVAQVNTALRPGVSLAIADDDVAALGLVPLLEGRTSLDGQPAAYVCR
ncbi:MAG: hypothetical protein ACI867_000024, partial [Glaciecola sp.]